VFWAAADEATRASDKKAAARAPLHPVAILRIKTEIVWNKTENVLIVMDILFHACPSAASLVDP
jgi:hypothetical protein